MKRRVCSYDMFAVPDPPFVLKDTVGEMYFCNLRCFCVSGRCNSLPGRIFLKRIKTEPIR
jgi:hypothetical protein